MRSRRGRNRSTSSRPLAGAHAPALYRVLRALASVGIFAEGADGRFRLTPLAEPLRGDAPGSVRPFALMLGEEWPWRPWGDLLHSATSGQAAFDRAYGRGIFRYLAERPEAGALFDAAMTSRSGPDAERRHPDHDDPAEEPPAVIVEHTGDLFSSACPALGHGVNSLGSMGAGIAVDLRRRWPALYDAYGEECRSGRLQPGGIVVHQAADRVVFNLAAQRSVGRGAPGVGRQAARATARLPVAGLALPRIGAGLAGLAREDVRAVRQEELTVLPYVELWSH
jgi:O-acetyl-ADP-ribose deacetylase (regulator of RNase III)